MALSAEEHRILQAMEDDLRGGSSGPGRAPWADRPAWRAEPLLRYPADRADRSRALRVRLILAALALLFGAPLGAGTALAAIGSAGETRIWSGLIAAVCLVASALAVREIRALTRQLRRGGGRALRG
jgi:hypothetical protein